MGFELYDDRSMWFGLDDTPISMMEATLLLSNLKKRRVAQTVFYRRGKRYHISTVHLVLNHQWSPNEPPLIYETMVFSDDPVWDQIQSRYPFRGMAKAGHRVVVEEILNSLTPAPKPTYKYNKNRRYAHA